MLLKKTRQNYLCKVVLCSARPPRRRKTTSKTCQSIPRIHFGLPSCLPVRCLCSRRTRCACPEPRREPGNVGIVLLPSWSSAKPFSPRSTLAFLFVLFLFLLPHFLLCLLPGFSLVLPCCPHTSPPSRFIRARTQQPSAFCVTSQFKSYILHTYLHYRSGFRGNQESNIHTWPAPQNGMTT